MRRYLASPLSLIVLAATACAPPAPPPPDLAAEEQAVRAISMQWLEYDKAQDFAAAAGLFADDGVKFLEKQEPVVGRAALEAHWVSWQAENPNRVGNWATDRVEVSASADLAVEYGTWSDTNLGPDGSGQDEGRYVTVYRKVDGVWKVAADISLSTKPGEAPSN